MSEVDPIIEAAAKRVCIVAGWTWDRLALDNQEHFRKLAIAARTDPPPAPPRKSLGEINREGAIAHNPKVRPWKEVPDEQKGLEQAAALVVAEHVRRGLIAKLKERWPTHIPDVFKVIADANLEELP